MKFGFRSKIYIGMLSLLLLLGIVIIFAVSRILTHALLEENSNRGISIGTTLAARVAEPILAMDFLRMKNLVDETVRLSDDIYYTFVLGAEGEALVHTFKGGFPVDLKTVNTVADRQQYSSRLLDTGNELVYDYAVPVMIGGDRFGTVHLGLLRIRVQKAINHLILSTILLTGFVILIAGFLGTAFASQVIRRIKILNKSAEEALRGNLDVRTAPLLKKNCWEIMNCDNPECPAFGNTQHRCWYMAGTLCPTCVEGEYAKKIESCVNCSVYRKCSGDEIQGLAESFDFMTLSLKTHIADLKDAEETLKGQRQLLKTVLDATPDFVSLQDRRFVYQAVNKAFCKITRKREQDIIGKIDADLFPRQQVEIYRQEDRRILKTGEPLIKESRITGTYGVHWLHIVKIPVEDSDGRIVGLLCSGRDITELKRIQKQLNQAQKMESVGQLTAGIAHEINTPLGIILGYTQLLMEDAESGSQAGEDLRTIEKQTKICRKIVSDLLEFSRDTESIVSPLDLNRSLKNVISVVEHTYKLDRIDIEQKYDFLLPLYDGDKEKFKQVFINLLNNARDAIGTDGTISTTTRFDKVNREIKVYFADTGCGIPDDRIDRIFDPFFSTKSVAEGTGLGLSVSFGIIREHGGRIEAESPPSPALQAKIGAPKQGTVFIITLPIAQPGQAGAKNKINHHKKMNTGS